VLICYLDDSGTDDASPLVTMAGYVAPLPRWIAFERSAKDIFAEFEVAQLHGKEFNDTKGNFEKWPRRRKEIFAARLYVELKKIVSFGVTASMSKVAFAKAKSLPGHEHPSKSAYGHCFGEILDQIMYSAAMKNAATFGATLSFVVEAGNKNDADVLRIFNEAKWSPRNLGVDKVLKSVSFVDKGSTIALQMADFLAFHARRYAMQCEKARGYLPMSDLQKIIFYAIPTAITLSHEYRTNQEIKAGIKDPNRWRTASFPWEE
jgi:hypothetical protein